MTTIGPEAPQENLLKEINFLAHSPGVDAWIRDRLQNLHRRVRYMERELIELRKQLDNG